jgi:hypothetical protein
MTSGTGALVAGTLTFFAGYGNAEMFEKGSALY